MDCDPQAHLISSVVSNCNGEVTNSAIVSLRGSKEGQTRFKDEATKVGPMKHKYAIPESYTKVAQHNFPSEPLRN